MTHPAGLFNEVARAVKAHQPELSISCCEDIIILEGPFVLSGPKGPFDFYEVRLCVPANFPCQGPVVFETGGRVPKVVDRHVFPKHGNCCLGVWEEWLLTAPVRSFEAFLTGPLHDYFVSQSWFDAKGEWPYGDRAHGENGIIESYAEILGVSNDVGVVAEYLRLLSKARAKGHYPCPCGSGRRLRNCHRDQITELRDRIDPAMAKRMLSRVRNI